MVKTIYFKSIFQKLRSFAQKLFKDAEFTEFLILEKNLIEPIDVEILHNSLLITFSCGLIAELKDDHITKVYLSPIEKAVKMLICAQDKSETPLFPSVEM
jgi:hypothetical protein